MRKQVVKACRTSLEQGPAIHRVINRPARAGLTLGLSCFDTKPEMAEGGSDYFFMYDYTVQLPDSITPATIFPVGDIHGDHPAFSQEAWDFWKSQVRSAPIPLIIGMGDYGDLMSDSEREAYDSIKGKLHDTTRKSHEQGANRMIDWLEVEFRGLMDDGAILIGLGEGNHKFVYPDGRTITQKLCTRLGCQYLGVMWVLGITFAEKNGYRFNIDIVGHHGMGAARLIGGSLNRVQQMAEAWEADIYLMGHDHKKNAGSDSRMVPVRDAHRGFYGKQRRQFYLRTGAFMRGYEPGMPSYVAAKAMKPTDLGAPRITINRWRVGDNRRHMLEATV